MQILYPIFFICLIAGPILLAWLKGDQILDRLTAHRQQVRQRRRQRSTHALPVREKVLQKLLGAEAQRDRIDDRIGEALAAFRQLSEGWRITGSSQNSITVDEFEQILLTRESFFNTYIDIAWLQSESIELLVREVDLLRELADLPPDWPKAEATSSRTPAAQRLLQNLDSATKKRVAVDRKLNRIGPSRPDTASGSHFDATVE